MAKQEQKELAENLDSISLRESHKERRRLTGKKKFKFEIGTIAASEKLLDQMEKTRKVMLERDRTPDGSFISFVWKSFARHCLCDWGDVSQEEKDNNNKALKSGEQLFSSYKHTKYPTICILTEADRSQTGIGLSEEFSEG